MPISRDEATALAELLCVVQPKWNTRGVIVKGLGPLAKHPAPLEVITWAAIRAARDPNNLTPAVIPLNGPHWNLADRPAPPRLTPELECPRHPGQWAGNCGPCRADQLAEPDPEPPADWGDVPEHLDRATLLARMRDQVRDGRDAVTEPASEPDMPTYGTPEHTREHLRQPPRPPRHPRR